MFVRYRFTCRGISRSGGADNWAQIKRCDKTDEGIEGRDEWSSDVAMVTGAHYSA